MPNKGFMKHVLGKSMKREGIKDFDLESEVDSELSLKENFDKMEDELDMSLRKDEKNSADVRREEKRADVEQGKRRHEHRRRKEQQIDESINAEDMRMPPLTDEEFEDWAENPEESDIFGVDGGLW